MRFKIIGAAAGGYVGVQAGANAAQEDGQTILTSVTAHTMGRQLSEPAQCLFL